MLVDVAKPMCELLVQLRDAGIIVASVTNVNEIHRGKIEERWPKLLKLFHVDGASHLLRVRKGDHPDYFETVHHRVNKQANGTGPIRPEEIAFIDDGKSNCELATQYGLNAIHFAYSGPESVTLLKQELIRVGVPPEVFG